MPANNGNNIHRIADYQQKSASPRAGEDLKSGGSDGTSGGMEARVAKLEAAVEHIQRDTRDIKSDLRGIRDLMWSNFKLTFAALIAVAIGLAGLMAKGFHWI